MLATLAAKGYVGHAYDDEECSLGLRCVAAPVRDRRGAVVAAVSFSGPTQRLSIEKLRRMAAVVKAAGLQISQSLGYTGPSGA